MKRKIQYGALALSTLVALSLTGCNGNPKPNGGESPIYTTAVYSERVIDGLQIILDTAKALHASIPTVVTDGDLHKVATATKIAGDSLGTLLRALKAGSADALTTKQAVVEVVKSLFTDLPKQLSPGAQAKIQPYINTALALLNLMASAPNDTKTVAWTGYSADYLVAESNAVLLGPGVSTTRAPIYHGR